MARAGDEWIQKHGQVMPDDAPPHVASLYEDIRTVLRVPFVNSIFRVLANRSDELERAWVAVRPGLRTAAFEAAADDLRSSFRLDAGAHTEGDLRWSDFVDGGLLGRFTWSIHHVLPKLLLIATAWAQQRTQPVIRPDDPGVAPRPLEGAEAVELVDPKSAEGAVAEIFDRVRCAHDHPAVASWFRGLAQRPTALRTAWDTIEPHVGGDEWCRVQAALLSRASAHVERLFEPSAPIFQPDVEPAIEAFRGRMIPDLLLDVGLVSDRLGAPPGAAEA